MSTSGNTDYIKSAERTIRIESASVSALLDHLDDQFVQACQFMLDCRGRVVVTGMGKSGHIGSKIAATLASTGTPAFFVHPGEASHGDLGMITRGDVVLALSNSGNTSEVITLLPLLKRLGVPLISMTGNPNSTLARGADTHLYAGVEEEACPLGLAPTSSTTVALVMGDALAVALLEARGFSAEDFAFSHPGGALGRRLLLKVEDIMHSGDRVPITSPDAPLSTALLEMTSKGLGMTCIAQEDRVLKGVFTDGDLRRALDHKLDPLSTTISKIMTSPCKSVAPDALAAEALRIMEEKKINALPVVSPEGKLVGALNMHDLLRAGVI